jgi:hypothetical protein
MSSYISCYNQETRELEQFKVPKSVYVYVIQLECEIKYGRGGVQKLYPGRFEGKYDIEDWKEKAFDKEDFDYQTYIEDYK